MTQIGTWMDAVMGLSLQPLQIGFGHMAVRAFLMYVLLIVLVRFGKKRFLGNATAFDYILVVLVGAIAGRAMTGGAAYFPSLLGIAILIAMHWVFSALASRSPWFSHLIKGNATRLIQGGKVDAKALARAHMSKDDLSEDLRSHGEQEAHGVERAYLERSGKLSVIKKSKA
jgi:uncharacterized membrane protein YcaP (DUF421 family)